ncbi:MAG: lytic transglycosylase domain-containing protein [Leptospirales bacterium]|nr:lytic transglycosylase domain-containing protein [Leptospirales bacterium]
MIEDMYNVMLRINEIKSRFGLMKPKNDAIGQEGRVKDKSFDEMLDERAGVLNKSYDLYEEGSVTRKDIDKIVEYYSKRSGVPADLVHSLIKVESDYNVEAHSPKGAMGLAQLMPETVMELGIENPFDPEENIKGGVTLLKSLIDRNNGDYKLALAAYNAGQKSVDKAGGIPDFKETKEYVKKVLDLYNEESGR